MLFSIELFIVQKIVFLLIFVSPGGNKLIARFAAFISLGFKIVLLCFRWFLCWTVVKQKIIDIWLIHISFSCQTRLFQLLLFLFLGFNNLSGNRLSYDWTMETILREILKPRFIPQTLSFLRVQWIISSWTWSNLCPLFILCCLIPV